MDLKEGTLKRVAPSRHPVERLRLDIISEDSDEADGTFFNEKSPRQKGIDSLNLSIDSDVIGTDDPFARNKSLKSRNTHN